MPASFPVRLRTSALRGLMLRAMRRAAMLIAAAGAFLLFGWAALGLVTPPPLLEGVPFGSIVLDAEGGILRVSMAEDGIFRLRASLDDIAPSAVDALVFYEDRHFFSHPGVNAFSLLRAAWTTYLSGERRVGGSTITMQVARMRLKLDSSGIAGKLRQIGYALLLERHYDKQDILEAYLNLAPYGGNVEGIEAAARIYFGRPAARLTELESLALTVVPQNPVRRDPVRGPDFDAARLRLHRLFAGYGGTQTESAGKGGAGPAAGEAPRLRVSPISRLPFKAPHASAELLAEAGAKGVAGRIASTIEPDLQAMLESCLRTFAERGRRFGLDNASALLVHAPTMRVCALAGSADFFDAAIQGQVDGTRAKRSPGSTLKPFIYALALEQGLIHPMTLLIDSPRSFGGYDPENFDRGFRGPVHAHEALKASRNLPAIILAEQLAEPGLYGFLQRAQVRLPMPPEHYGLALVLGGAEVSMRELAALYAMLANQGLWHPLRLRQDEALGGFRRLLSPEAAYVTLRMLEKEEDTLRTREGSLPLRCKTGTSNGFRDAWTAGLVGEYVLVVWAGHFDGSSHPYLVGARTALPLFRETAQALGSLRPLRDPLPAQRPALALDEIPVCTATGDVDVSRCADTAETLFIPGVSPIRDSGILRPILIDRATGLRACEPRPGETEEVFWEFWPSDVRAIFAQAGIAKPLPPDWLPVCKGREGAAAGRAPRIILPKKGMAYYRSLGGLRRPIPLSAAADPGVVRIHWFAGASYLGSSAPNQPFLWEPEQSGEFEISAVDDRGRSARQLCRIQLTP